MCGAHTHNSNATVYFVISLVGAFELVDSFSSCSICVKQKLSCFIGQWPKDIHHPYTSELLLYTRTFRAIEFLCVAAPFKITRETYLLHRRPGASKNSWHFSFLKHGKQTKKLEKNILLFNDATCEQ